MYLDRADQVMPLPLRSQPDAAGKLRLSGLKAEGITHRSVLLMNLAVLLLMNRHALLLAAAEAPLDQVQAPDAGAEINLSI